MGFTRQHFFKVRKQPRHAQVALCMTHCVDCQQQLQATHLVIRFGNRCRHCFDAFMNGAVLMASQYGAGNESEN